MVRNAYGLCAHTSSSLLSILFLALGELGTKSILPFRTYIVVKHDPQSKVGACSTRRSCCLSRVIIFGRTLCVGRTIRNDGDEMNLIPEAIGYHRVAASW
jgi:hypothetical protein